MGSGLSDLNVIARPGDIHHRALDDPHAVVDWHLLAEEPKPHVSSSSLSVSGTIQFEGVRRAAEDVTVFVRVEEVSRQDAPSSRVAEAMLARVTIPAGTSSIAFSVHGVPRAPGARYVLRVHADVDRDGVVSRGDYVSTRTYPVAADVTTAGVTVAVREVS
jgi:hypothetical protein